MKEAVLAREPMAYAQEVKGYTRVADGSAFPMWQVSRASPTGKRLNTNAVLGTGESEEAAWREALSRMRIADNEEAERG